MPHVVFGHTCTIKLFLVFLKFSFHWASCTLSDSQTFRTGFWPLIFLFLPVPIIVRNTVGYLCATPILPIQWVSVLWTVTLDIYKFLFLPAFSAISLFIYPILPPSVMTCPVLSQALLRNLGSLTWNRPCLPKPLVGPELC